MAPRSTTLVAARTGVPVQALVVQVPGLTVVVGTREPGTSKLRFEASESQSEVDVLMGLAKDRVMKQARPPMICLDHMVLVV